MGRSVADTPTTPEFLRVSDAEREHAVDELKKEFIDGRLSQETFMLRMQAALGARNSGQLAGLFGDLPLDRPRSGRRLGLPGLARARAAARQLGENTRAVLADGAAALAEPFRAMTAGRDRFAPPELPSAPGAPSAPSAPLPAPRPASPPAPLVFPPGSGTSFTIGRDQSCDLYVADMTVSRLHARLARDAQGWLLTDLDSTNGTRLNGWRVRAAVPVRAGDLIRFGSAEFIVQPDRDASSAGPSAGPYAGPSAGQDPG